MQLRQAGAAADSAAAHLGIGASYIHIPYATPRLIQVLPFPWQIQLLQSTAMSSSWSP